MYDWLHRFFSSSHEKTVKLSAVPEAKIEIPSITALQALQALQTLQTPRPPTSQAIPAISWMQHEDINTDFTSWLFEGSDYSDMLTSQIEKDILGALDKIVKSKQSGANLVRRMPGVVPQLLQSLRTEDFSGTELARKISHDVVLVAAVIRLANSSFYGRGKTITSIEHAVLILGHAGLRQLITSVAFKPIIDLKSAHFTKLIAPRVWDQSEKCGAANRLLARNERVDPFEAFLAGLIQDVGLIVSLGVMDQMSDGNQRLGSGSFCHSLMNYARMLSCSIGKEWHFPESITTAIEEQSTNRKPATISPMGKILSMGNYLSKMHILIRHNRLSPDDPTFTTGLSEKERHCLKELDEIDEEQQEDSAEP